MSKTMIDCTGANAVAVYNKRPDAAIVGCYVTGSTDVVWSDAEKALWSEKILVTIDQGYQSPEITTATVRDVETEAWSPTLAADKETWSPTVARPTIYVDRDELPAVLNAGWKDDLWLALPGWAEGDPLPDHGDCTVVAVQNATVDDLYDTSIVLDQTWPDKGSVSTMTVDQSAWAWCSKCQGLFYGPKKTESACPRGGTHDDEGSFVYTLTAEEAS
jgi:hypothetical protein